MTPGIAIDARIASSTAPRCSHTDLPASRSGAHRGEGDRQLLDGGGAQNVAHRVENLLGPQHAGCGDRRIQQPQD